MPYATQTLPVSALPSSPEPEETIHRAFEAQAARTPHAPAVLFEGETLTYDDLNGKANQIARALRRQGAGPGAVVGICVHRSPEMVAGLLGILKAGAAYLPLDPDYPAERLRFMLEDSEADALLTQKNLRAHLPNHAGPVFCLDPALGEFDTEAADHLPDGAAPEDLAYVIYTSGSTGRPKGVEVRHRGVVNNLRWRQATFPLTASDRLLQTYSFSFDPSVWAFFWPLTVGAAVALPPPGRHGDPDYLVEIIKNWEISILGFSPSMLSVLLEHPGIAECRSLRHVFCGGEPLTVDLQQCFFARLDAALHNVYGPTEATIDAAWWTCRRDDGLDPIPIGFPLPQTEIYVLAADGQPAPPGHTGELCLAGVNLARGYRHRPELTAEKFIPNPLEPARFPVLYRTGDLGRRGPDGAIECLGRRDQQVKIRGFRIETGEIEAVLARHPQVRTAVVLAREDQPGERRLVGYIVPETEPPSRSALREGVQSALPEYMVPSAFVFLDALPLSPNGKLERNALPAPDASDWEREGALALPETPLQETLVAVFESLLSVQPLGIRDDFWEWGGHSLLAARLTDEIASLTGRRLPLTALAGGATVEHLADLLDQPEEAAMKSPLFQRWTNPAGTPFFFWHGSFTGGLYCAELARRLGADRPVYTFSPQGTHGTPIPPTMEAMAAEHLALLREVQPAGPYWLGGFCNGGLVAYEVARQLRAQNEQVRFLALVEINITPTYFKLRLLQGLRRFVRRRERLELALQSGLVPFLLALKLANGLWARSKRALRRDQGVDWGNLIPDEYRKAVVRYHLRDYDGPLTLIAVQEAMEKGRIHPCTGWRDLARTLELVVIPGSPYETLNRRLPDLAECLRARLAAGAVAGD